MAGYIIPSVELENSIECNEITSNAFNLLPKDMSYEAYSEILWQLPKDENNNIVRAQIPDLENERFLVLFDDLTSNDMLRKCLLQSGKGQVFLELKEGILGVTFKYISKEETLEYFFKLANEKDLDAFASAINYIKNI